MKPPPLLLGAALVFWSAQTQNWIAGVILAVLFELPNVTDHRSNLSRSDFERAWDLCVVLFVGGAFYCYMTVVERLRMAFVFTEWTPVVFAPIALAQAFSTTPLLPLGVFSWFLRKERRISAEPRVSSGYFYFAVCLVAASVSNRPNAWFYPLLCLLVGWCLWGLRPRRYPAAIWCSFYLAVACGGYAAQLSGSALQNYAEGRFNMLFSKFARGMPDAAESWTSIGAVGRRQLSARIALRLSSIGPPPPLLREATFAFYRHERWSAPPLRDTEPGSAAIAPFLMKAGFTQIYAENRDGSSWMLHKEQTNTVPGRNSAAAKSLAAMNISTYLPAGKAVLALPTAVFRLDDLPVGTLETNRYESVRVANGPGVVSFEAHYGPRIVLGPPPDAKDLEVPAEEMPALRQIAGQLALSGKRLPEAMRIIRSYFEREFSYSTYQAAPERNWARTNTPLALFLLRSKTGHCEYFATATALLLREAGFPARYIVGYAVTERPNPRGECVVRERDAHAWCQVYDGDAWVDYDTTPAGWEAVEKSKARSWEPAYDFISELWFGFSKWRWLGSRDGIIPLLWIFVPVIAWMTWRIISAANRQKRHKGAAGAEAVVARQGLDSEFYLLEARLKSLGLERAEHEPVRPWMERVKNRLPRAIPSAELKLVLQLHYRYRFDPEGLTPAERGSLSQHTRECLQFLAR